MNGEQSRFSGIAQRLAEDRFAASFAEDTDNELMFALYQEYLTDASGMGAENWLNQRLPEVFPCVDQRPEWIEEYPIWPFCDGRPMAFIAQVEVQASEVSDQMLSSGSTLYIFGCRQPFSVGWKMHYQVVEQLPDLP